MSSEKLKACIIAGGKSGRFGSDKSIHIYDGKPMISHTVDAVKPVFDDIYIIAPDVEKFEFLGLDIIPDVIPSIGPIGGIYTALEKVDAERIFIFPCDMPFMNTEFIRYMTEIPGIYDIIVPEVNGYYQPLHAIYSKKCHESIRKRIEAEDYRMTAFFEGHSLRKVNEDEIGYYDDPETMFKNINFRTDLH